MKTTIETSGSKDARAPSILHKDTKMMVKHYQGSERSSLKVGGCCRVQVEVSDGPFSSSKYSCKTHPN